MQQENPELISFRLRNFRFRPMPPKLNRKRALFVLKIDEIWRWNGKKRQSGIPTSSNLAGICARCGQGSTGGWRT